MFSIIMRISVLIATLGGCDFWTGSTPGEDSKINFYEPNKYPEDKLMSSIGFERAIALGSRVDVWTTSPGIASFVSAEIDRPEILRIVSSFYPITLRALSEGTARLRVKNSDGLSDTLPLTVIEPDDARIWIIEDNPLFDRPNRFYGDGNALRAGANLLVAATTQKAGEPLLGFDLFHWAFNETLLSHRDGSMVNTLKLNALGVSGVTTITTQLGGEIEVATLSESDIIELKIHYHDLESNSSEQVSEIFIEEVFDLYTLTGNDIDGRYVSPGPTDDNHFNATITEGTLTLLEATLIGRRILVRACPGSGTIRFSYLGTALSVPITVTPEGADEDCPQQ